MLNNRAGTNQRDLLSFTPKPMRVPVNSPHPEPMGQEKKYQQILRTQDWVDGRIPNSNQLVRSIQFVSENNRAGQRDILGRAPQALLLSQPSLVSITHINSDESVSEHPRININDIPPLELPPAATATDDPDLGLIRSRLTLNH